MLSASSRLGSYCKSGSVSESIIFVPSVEFDVISDVSIVVVYSSTSSTLVVLNVLLVTSSLERAILNPGVSFSASLSKKLVESIAMTAKLRWIRA